LRSKSKN